MARVADPPGASDAMGPALIPITAIDRDRHRNSWHLTNKVIGENTLAVTWAGTKPRERFRYGLLPTCKTPLVGDRDRMARTYPPVVEESILLGPG